MHARGPILPIPTVYDGVRFRSRLEARYAVMLNNLGVRYQYEAEAYSLDERGYLCDFYLPAHDLWIEIKPAAPSAEEVEACRQLAEHVEGRVFLLYGPFAWWIGGVEERRAGGVMFWTEREGEKRHAFAHDARRYEPAVCNDCGRFGIAWRGIPANVCEGNHLDIDSPLNLPALYVASRIAETYQFDGGR